jgi:hypothetical protein
MVTTIAIAVIAASLSCSFLYATLILLYAGRAPVRMVNLSSYPKTNVFLTLRSLDDGLEENLHFCFLS